jgi:F-type H+-transporting ATPase subunit b
MRRMALWGLLALGMALMADPAWAKGEEVSAFRQIWDQVWLIINFLVLAFLIYKFAKQPMIDFLNGQRNLIAIDLDEVTKLRKAAQAELKALRRKTDCLGQEILQFEDRAAQAAAKERDHILAQAKRESDLIIERAGLWSEQALRKAKSDLAAEIVELASQIAVEKLKENISADDKTRFLDQFSQNVGQTG